MKTIVVRSRFSALHMYEDAPEVVSFLRHPHRHMFHVEAEIKVSHGNRELEFFTVKYELDTHVIQGVLRSAVPSCGVWVLKQSCEDIAEGIAASLMARFKLSDKDIVYVEVSEDGENAGRWYPE